MMHQNFAIIDRTNRVPLSILTAIAAVIGKQLSRDVSPIWGGSDTVVALANESQLQPHFVPCYIVDDSQMPEGALGYHTDTLGQPQAFVSFQNGDRFAICKTLSHEIIETKIDFSGMRLVPSWHPVTNEPVRILCEACDPSEELDYQIDGYTVSDFIRPEWYDQNETPGTPYTFLKAMPKPRTIIAGGYVSFVDANGQGWQQTWFDNNGPVIQGPFDWSTDARAGKSIRELVDAQTAKAKKAA